MTYNKIGPLMPQDSHEITWRPDGTVEEVEQGFVSYVDEQNRLQARLCYREGPLPATIWLKELLVGLNYPQALAQSPDEPLKIDGRDFTDSDKIMTLFGSDAAEPRLIRDCPHTAGHKYWDGKRTCRYALQTSVQGYEVCTEEPPDPQGGPAAGPAVG